MKYENQSRFQNLSKRFRDIPTHIFYAIHLSIAVDEWAKEMNQLAKIHQTIVINSSGGESFLIKTPNGYVKNDVLIRRSIKMAREHGECRRFHFFYKTKVLRRLKDELLKEKCRKRS